MIAKGNTHSNGDKLARYLMDAKEGERAERWQLVGFAASDLREAFRSVHVIAAATRCEQPFFHVQVRNPDGEELTRDQWRRVVDRIENRLGLTDQPRAIVFHINKKTGHEHIHVAWSRIDAETMTARPLPWFKERLKDTSRKLEIELDLTRVKNERDGPVRAPRRNEFEEARRLGVDLKEVRQTIRDCFERSDNGRSFEAALADHRLVLAQGDRRDFVVIDHEGGKHALSKRILGISAAQIRDRLADLDRNELPSVEHATSFVREQQGSREKIRLEKMPDLHRDEMAWQDALAKAAIEKEKSERRFVEPGAGRETPFTPPVTPLHPMLNRTSPEFWFEDVARQVAGERSSCELPPEAKGFAKEIRKAYFESSGDPKKFAEALEPKAMLACVTKEEADRSQREAAIAKENGRFEPSYRDGEIVVVKDPGLLYRRYGEITEARRVYKLDRYTTGEDRARLEKFVARIDRKQLQGIEATKEKLNIIAAERAEDRYRNRLESAQQVNRSAPEKVTNTRAPAAVVKTAERAVTKTLDVVGKALESLLAPVLTPEQKRQGALTQAKRAADAKEKIDVSQYLADLAQRRQREEREQEPIRQRQRDDRER